MIQDCYPTWKGYLFRLQQEAPKPRPVVCQRKNVSNRPHFYGPEHHGFISREEGENLCCAEGNFLIRESQTEAGRFTLVLRVLGMVKNFKLYYENGKHFVGEKRFDSVYALAEDGLITMYVESKAQGYIESMAREPVYNSLSRYSSIGSRHGTTKIRHPDKRSFYPSTPSPVDNEQLVGYSASALHPHNDYPRASPALLDSSSIDEEAEEFYYEPGYVPSSVLDSGYERSDPESLNGRDGVYLRYSEESRSMIPVESSSEQTTRMDIGGKKHLTPTSSDERKRTKKRIATEDHFQRQQRGLYQNNDLQLLQEEELYKELAAGSISVASTNNQNLRRVSYDHYERQKSEEKVTKDDPPRRVSSALPVRSSSGLSPYHRPSVVQKQATTVAHVRQLSNGTEGRLQGCTQEKQDLNVIENEDISSNERRCNPYYVSTGNHSVPVPSEGTSLDQLMAVHRQLEEDESRHRDVTDDEYDGGRCEFHIRQKSDPVEPMYRQESSFVGQDFSFCRGSQAVNERLPQRNKLAYRSQLLVNRTGSVGSCESGLSNSSSGVDRADTSSSNRTHDSSLFSSEDDRNTPSPRHRSVLQRQMSDLPVHQHSSVYAPDARSSRITPPIEESPWLYRRDVERKPSRRSRSSSANRRRAPLSQINSNNSSDVDEKTSKKKNDAVYQNEENRERRNSADLSTSSRDPQASPLPSPRHKSESGGVLEPAQNITELQTSSKPKPKLRTSLSINQANVEQRKPKPVQRRATTSEITISKNKDVQPSSPRIGNVKNDDVKTKSSSPTKSKKSVTSPLLRHHSGASQSHRYRHVTSKSSRCKGGIAQQYEKQHQYKSHTYRGLQWCEYCGNFMWGVIQQGVQCLDCGLNVHKQCSKLVPNDCQPALKHVKHAYGVDLTTLVKLHGTQRPLVVDMCIAEIEKRGMNEEGIYKVSGSHDDVMELKAAFDQDGVDADLPSCEDIHIIAEALKLYFRELPVPLIPYQLYSRFINAAKISHSDGKLDAIRMGLAAMPGAHLQTVKYLIQHLGRVTEQSFLNQMSAHNLGAIFGPTILRAPEKEALDPHMNDTRFQQEVVAAIIEYRHCLFGAGHVEQWET